MRSEPYKHLIAANFSEFEDLIRKLEQQRTERIENLQGRYVSHYLYRGQASSEWTLSTTLERSGHTNCKVSDYYGLISRVKPHLESLSGSRWPSLESFDKIWELLSSQEASRPDFLPAYDFLVHLRHHGFPSPLLDWSASPYVALFFAFSKPAVDADSVSVYIYQDHTGIGKVGGSGAPTIDRRGPYVTTHRRHALQQAEYTLCARRYATPSRFASHEEAFSGPYVSDEQDLLWKIDLPVSERIDALRRLDQFNLNAFSLFGTEEALLETLFIRENIEPNR